MTTSVQLWKPNSVAPVRDDISDPSEILGRALQLRSREKRQIEVSFESGHYEIAMSFLWMRTMALLKNQLSLLGNEFIGELLQRPDINEFSDLQKAISDSEAISLAFDLGMLTPLQSKRLLHSQDIVWHFAASQNESFDDDDGDGEFITKEEAIQCLRVCVQGVLGHETVGVASDFKAFRDRLESETFSANSPEIDRLRSSPYFFIRTAVSVLLGLFRSAKGAQLEHTSRNAHVIIPLIWGELKKPERWQIGQAYASLFNDGDKQAVKGLHAVLLAVQGFDYVPENLRSRTFFHAASAVIAAHQGMNNFYNEPGPMRELASLGTSIPGPAVAACVTALLCVKLGNTYGFSWAAQSVADELAQKLSDDRWSFYLNERFDQDRLILDKLTRDSLAKRWISMMRGKPYMSGPFTNKGVRRLAQATNEGNVEQIVSAAEALLKSSFGST